MFTGFITIFETIFLIIFTINGQQLTFTVNVHLVIFTQCSYN